MYSNEDNNASCEDKIRKNIFSEIREYLSSQGGNNQEERWRENNPISDSHMIQYLALTRSNTEHSMINPPNKSGGQYSKEQLGGKGIRSRGRDFTVHRSEVAIGILLASGIRS